MADTTTTPITTRPESKRNLTEIEYTNVSTVELIKTNATDDDVAYAAWVSNYGDEARSRGVERIDGLINFLYRERHMSPFEHGSFTFFVETPIFVAREFMRHRTASYNEHSARYSDLEPMFWIPADDRPIVQTGKVGAYRFEVGTPEQYEVLNEEMLLAYEQCWSSYQNMKRAGIANEVARAVLPVGIYTRFYVTMNPRNVMQFLTLRNDPNAQQEIREVAAVMEQMFAEAMPLTYKAYVEYDWRKDKAELEALREEVEALKATGLALTGRTL